MRCSLPEPDNRWTVAFPLAGTAEPEFIEWTGKGTISFSARRMLR
jgi:hypothetical protein